MRRLIWFLVVLAILLVAADRVAWYTAERVLATQIQSSQNLSERPDVSVAGFPFLTQVLRGRYQEVDAQIHDLSVEKGLTIDTLHVELRGVRVSTGDLINGDVSKAPVDTASASSTVSYASLDQAAKENIPDGRLKVNFSKGDGETLAVVGSYTSSALKVQLNAQADVTVRDGDLIVGLQRSSLDELPALVRQQVTALVGTPYELPPLPFGFKVKSVTLGADGVNVRAAAKSVVLSAP